MQEVQLELNRLKRSTFRDRCISEIK